MGRTTSVYTITHVAKMLGETLELLEEIASNADNLDYGDIVTIWTGDEETITSFTDDGIDSLRAFIRDVRTWSGGIHQFLTGSLCEPDVIERIMSDEPKT
ncbi:hypothetical protein [Hoeflea alexandrii]|uniref:hypothetical protein n=1 Tax=Hoeflea alexandrii TaxID=288436 RepID=UPI0022AF641A|nr:hypothetical protein [Hoeflea alexandrii]MCZ4288468.1 hypothetical protein [Hoeflea alexandrii]